MYTHECNVHDLSILCKTMNWRILSSLRDVCKKRLFRIYFYPKLRNKKLNKHLKKTTQNHFWRKIFMNKKKFSSKKQKVAKKCELIQYYWTLLILKMAISSAGKTGKVHLYEIQLGVLVFRKLTLFDKNGRRRVKADKKQHQHSRIQFSIYRKYLVKSRFLNLNFF